MQPTPLAQRMPSGVPLSQIAHLKPEAVATAPVFMRARLQLARLQDVIDYGVGDVRRAADIYNRIRRQLEWSADNEWIVAAHNNPTMLGLVLADWRFAIDSVCAELERPTAETLADYADHMNDRIREDRMIAEWEAGQ